MSLNMIMLIYMNKIDKENKDKWWICMILSLDEEL